jgi:hypothetical protein
MIAKHKIILAACTLMVQGIGAANAGPCNTRDKDAGSGPSPATRADDWHRFGGYKATPAH